MRVMRDAETAPLARIRIEVVLNIFSNRSHISQVVTGFLMLRDRRPADVAPVVLRDCTSSNAYPKKGIPLIEALCDGRRIIYDLEDSYWTRSVMRRYLDSCDHYFKRSFSASENLASFDDGRRGKMHPFGLLLKTDYPQNPYNDLQEPYAERSVRAMALRILRHATYSLKPEDIEASPLEDLENPSAIFVARLWDPLGTKERHREDREAVNAMRVELVRTLSRELGPRFFGGIQDGDYARRVASDLILPRCHTFRKAYVKRMHQAAVCIGSTGLHGSIGGRMGEYVAASRAIVTEPLHFEVLGPFDEGVNYRTFSTVDECVERVVALMERPDEILAMQRANRDYYREYLKPDRLIERSLETVGVL